MVNEKRFADFLIKLVISTVLLCLSLTIIFFLIEEFISIVFFPFYEVEDYNNFINKVNVQPKFYFIYWILDKILIIFSMLPIYIDFFSFLIPLLLCVAFLTLVERKVMAAIQRRQGPHIVGYFGILQPFADGLKLFIKEAVIPTFSNYYLFILAPVTSLFLSFVLWVVIPIDFGYSFMDINLAFLFVLGISSLSVYGIIVAGWSSNSKYAFLGSLRSAAQMISYEVSLGLIVLPLFGFIESFSFFDLLYIQRGSYWNIVLFFPLALLFFISALAETNRSPFDLPEAEAELVSGYNVEYSGFGFAFFFIAEYLNIIFMCFIFSIIFLGGTTSISGGFVHEMTIIDELNTLTGKLYTVQEINYPELVLYLTYFPKMFIFLIQGNSDLCLNWIKFLNFFNCQPNVIWLILKVYLMLWLFIAVRAIVPRYRYDQLMYLGWKSFLPLALAFFIIYFSLFVLFLFLMESVEVSEPIVFIDNITKIKESELDTFLDYLEGDLIDLYSHTIDIRTGEILFTEWPEIDEETASKIAVYLDSKNVNK